MKTQLHVQGIPSDFPQAELSALIRKQGIDFSQYTSKAAEQPELVNYTYDLTSRGTETSEAQITKLGTAITTVIYEKYPSRAQGNHAAVFLGEDVNGIRVIDSSIIRGD